MSINTTLRCSRKLLSPDFCFCLLKTITTIAAAANRHEHQRTRKKPFYEPAAGFYGCVAAEMEKRNPTFHPLKRHLTVLSPSPPSQRSFTAAVKLYDKGDYGGAIHLFEDALVEYYKADVECRALCQGPQRFDNHDHLRYHYSLHEVISGQSQTFSSPSETLKRGKAADSISR